MGNLTAKQEQTAAVIGMQIGSAVALALTVARDMGRPPETMREDFLQVCTELFDETASALSQPPQGAQLRPRAELLAMIDGLVHDGMQGGDKNRERLSALSEAAERIRADA